MLKRFKSHLNPFSVAKWLQKCTFWLTQDLLAYLKCWKQWMKWVLSENLKLGVGPPFNYRFFLFVAIETDFRQIQTLWYYWGLFKRFQIAFQKSLNQTLYIFRYILEIVAKIYFWYVVDYVIKGLESTRDIKYSK